MLPQAKKPRRDLYLVMESLITALGGYKVVAAACLVSPDNVNKWKQNPTDKGQTIPFVHLQTLFVLSGEQLANLAAQNAVDELLGEHLLNLCFRRAYLEEKVFEFVELLQGQKPIKAINE